MTDSKHNWPLQRGFSRYYGIIHGAASYYNPATLTDGNEFVKPDRQGYYFTDVLSNRASEYIRDAARKPDPFFLYLAFTSPHWPLHALESALRA